MGNFTQQLFDLVLKQTTDQQIIDLLELSILDARNGDFDSLTFYCSVYLRKRLGAELGDDVIDKEFEMIDKAREMAKHFDQKN